MNLNKHSMVLRILDDQNRLTDRADTKAISLLSTLGIFTVFFIAHFNDIPIVPFSVILLVIYFISVLSAILHIIMAISPRIRQAKPKNKDNQEGLINAQLTFFGGICQFPDVNAYKQSIDSLFNGDEALTDNYIHQVFEVANINNTKYKFVRRAVWLTVIALSSQIVLIAFTFAVK
jgi:hypothetical protein